DGIPHARQRSIKVFDDDKHWYEFGDEQTAPLGTLDIILMRKDPPFDMEYVYASYMLEHAEAQGCLVINRPRSLRDANEKFYASWFPQCTPPTLVTREPTRVRDFLHEHNEIVVKPLDIMGGQSIFRLKQDDPNITVVLDHMTGTGT